MHARRYSGIAGLKALCEAWKSLHPDAGLFARYEWHEALATHLLDEKSSLDYIHIFDGPHTIAIVPMLSSVAQVPPFGDLRVLNFGLHSHLSLTDFPLASDTHIDIVATLLLKELKAWPTPWEGILWPRILASSNVMKLARAIGGVRVHASSASPCDMLATNLAFSDFLSGLTSNTRKNLRRRTKRAEELGSLHWYHNKFPKRVSDSHFQKERFTEENGITAAYDAFLALEASGWKGTTGTRSAIALNPRTLAFYADLLSRNTEGFKLEIDLLTLDEKPIAGQFSVVVNRCKYLWKIGYNEEESAIAPGQLLMARLIKEACDRCIDRLNFITSTQANQAWRPDTEATFAVIVFRTYLRTLIYGAYRTLRRTLNNLRRRH